MTAMVPVAINGREDWTLQLPDFRAERVEWAWWEATRIAAMRRYLNTGDLVYDIGAEEGDMSALWASWGCDVVLCEPNAGAWPIIRAVFEANDLVDRVRLCVPAYLADVPHDEHDVVVSEPPRGPSAVGSWPDVTHGEMQRAHGFSELWKRPGPTTTIDRLVETTGLVPDAITMDIEGAEVLAIPGAARTLAEHRPIVFVSIHPQFCIDNYGLGNATVFQTMLDAGYVELYLGQDHEEHWMFTPAEHPWHAR